MLEKIQRKDLNKSQLPNIFIKQKKVVHRTTYIFLLEVFYYCAGASTGASAAGAGVAFEGNVIAGAAL